MISNDDFQKFVLGMMSRRAMRDEESKHLAAALGLAGEAGEFADLVKKGIFHEVGIDGGKLVLELGDILFYAAHAANTLGVSLGHVMEQNMAKLRARYKTGTFTVEEFQAKEAAKEVADDLDVPLPPMRPIEPFRRG